MINFRNVNNLKDFLEKNLIIVVLFISYCLQYNPIFLYKHLWTQYWDGSAIRTLYSLIGLIISLAIVMQKKIKINIGTLKVVLFLLLFWIYGTFIGIILNENYKFIIADGIFFIELATYTFVFSLINTNKLRLLLKSIIIYSGISNLFSIFLFLIRYDDMVVAQEVYRGKSLKRLVDFITPLNLVLVSFGNIFKNLKYKYLLQILFLIVIILGSFRSIWVALFFTLFSILNIYRKDLSFYNKNFLMKSFIILVGILSLEYISSKVFGTPSLIISRLNSFIPAAIVRISQTYTSLGQFSDSIPNLLFGYGYGATFEFFNDFGRGGINLNQPIGSLSNYYITFIGQFGILGGSIFFIFCGNFFINCLINLKKDSSLILFSFFLYLIFQVLTFPNFSHFPIAMTCGLVLNLSLNKLSFKEI